MTVNTTEVIQTHRKPLCCLESMQNLHELGCK